MENHSQVLHPVVQDWERTENHCTPPFFNHCLLVADVGLIILQEDRVIYWYRTHPKSATCSQGTLPRNSNFPADIVVAFSMLTSPAKITLDIGSSHAEFNAPAGVAIGSVPFSKEDNQTPSFGIVRDGKTVKSGKGGKAVTKACEYYNFNPTVGAI